MVVPAQMLDKTASNIDDHRNCGLEQHQQELLINPEYAASFYERQAVFQQKIQEIHEQKMNGTYQRMATLYIPVAVHFPDANEADRACLETYAQTQIDVINADYTATNSDISNWGAASTFYPGLNPGSVDVKFCIATMNHPATGDPEVTEGSPLVTIGANGSNFGSWPETDSRYSGYMNFIIKNIGSGLLGYSPLNGSIAAGNAVVMNTICYGTGSGCPSSGIVPQAPYNLGRTVTHELGHFYNLNHTFIADGGTSCVPADGDGIADTPKVAGSTYGNPANGSVLGCVAGEYALTMNYMDYVNDASMYMFTPGQGTVMEAYFASVAGDWATNVISCSGPNFSITAGDLGNCGADTAEATLSYSTENGFNENTTFTLTGLPSPAAYSFSPNSLSTDGSSILSISGLSSIADGVYPLQITATAASLTKNLSISLNVGTGSCDVSATTPWLTSITRVAFGSIDHASSSPDGTGAENNGYSDLTASQSTNVNIDESYDLIVHVDADGLYRTQTKAWIDWNQNCTFEASEEYDLGNASVTATANFDIPTTNSPLSITVPSNAVLGSTTMRVATIYSSPTQPYDYPTACGVNVDGEVEDYEINVLSSLSVNENIFEAFKMYPNPANSEVTIQLKAKQDVQITLFDIRGRKVFTNNYTNNSTVFNKTINLETISNGLYLIEIESGTQKLTKKLVIN